MDSELDVVRQINKLAGQARPVDLMMDLITRYGHWAFLIYGILLWFAPGKNQKHRRESCVAAFLAYCIFFAGRDLARQVVGWSERRCRGGCSAEYVVVPEVV